jgi:hypothetical protein
MMVLNIMQSVWFISASLFSRVNGLYIEQVYKTLHIKVVASQLSCYVRSVPYVEMVEEPVSD